MNKEWKETIITTLIGLIVINIGIMFYYIIWFRIPFVIIFLITLLIAGSFVIIITIAGMILSFIIIITGISKMNDKK